MRIDITLKMDQSAGFRISDEEVLCLHAEGNTDTAFIMNNIAGIHPAVYPMTG